MELRLRSGAASVKNKCIFSLLALALGVAAAYLAQLGILLLPLIAAPLAVVFTLERGCKRIFTVAVPLLLIAADVIFNGIYSFACLSAVVAALLIHLALVTSHLEKAESALLAVVIISVLTFLTVALYGCRIVNSFDFAKAMEYYRELVKDMRSEWILTLESYVMQSADPSAAEALTPEVLGQMYDSYIVSLYSSVVITVFAVVGLAYKLFVSIFSRFVTKKIEIYGWRFALSPVYAYTYIIFSLLQLFVSGNDAFSVVVINTANILMAMFAYMGFCLASAYFRMKSEGRSGGKFIMFILVLLLGSTAFLILSLIGVLASIMIGRSGIDESSSKNSDQGGSDVR